MWIIDIHLAGLTFLKYRTLQTYDNLIMNFDSIPPSPPNSDNNCQLETSLLMSHYKVSTHSFNLKIEDPKIGDFFDHSLARKNFYKKFS